MASTPYPINNWYIGELFNPNNWASNTTGVTIGYANNHYLTYPISQPALETINQLAVTTTLGFGGNISINGISVSPNIALTGSSIPTQSSNDIAIGIIASSATQTGNNNVSLGTQAGQNQAGQAVSIGFLSGATQTLGSIAIGAGSGINQTGDKLIAIGYNAGASQTGSNSIAIGLNAGANQGANNGIAIGSNSGASQLASSIAIGQYAGATQSTNCVALGAFTGYNQGASAISIAGYSSANTYTQGANAVHIGAINGNQTTNTLVINGSGTAITPLATTGTQIAPVRAIPSASISSTTLPIGYDSATNEMFTLPYVASSSRGQSIATYVSGSVYPGTQLTLQPGTYLLIGAISASFPASTTSNYGVQTCSSAGATIGWLNGYTYQLYTPVTNTQAWFFCTTATFTSLTYIGLYTNIAPSSVSANTNLIAQFLY